MPSPSVASHYDALDPVYRALWGGHVHHGLWRTGGEGALKAAEQLVDFVAARAYLRSGDRICDIGCGYGTVTRKLAREWGVRATGITISPRQHSAAASVPTENVTFVCGDWLANNFPDRSFERLIAIESTEHFPDGAKGIAEMARVLTPDGRMVIAAWMMDEAPTWLERRFLLDPVRRAGRLEGMTTAANYRRWLAAAGLQVISEDDLSSGVARTWTAAIRRAAWAVWRDSEFRRYVLLHPIRSLELGIALVLARAAYATGALKYAILTAVKTV